MTARQEKVMFGVMLAIFAGILLVPASSLFAQNEIAIQNFVLNIEQQIPDLRDFSITDLFNFDDSEPVAATVDLRPKCPPVFDQKTLGACSSMAGCAAFMMASGVTWIPSRLFQYYNERLIEGDVSKDGGAQMRDIGKALSTYGVCPESFEPYVVGNFANQPSAAAYSNALNNKIKGYYSISTLQQIKQTLQTSQKPVLAYIKVYDNFESTGSDGMVAMPSGNFLGGHAVLVVGYSEAGQYLIVRNSWGVGWGKSGYCFIPYNFITQGYASDFWYLDYNSATT